MNVRQLVPNEETVDLGRLVNRLAAPVVRCLEKPFSMPLLLQSVRDAARGRAAPVFPKLFSPLDYLREERRW